MPAYSGKTGNYEPWETPLMVLLVSSYSILIILFLVWFVLMLVHSRGKRLSTRTMPVLAVVAAGFVGCVARVTWGSLYLIRYDDVEGGTVPYIIAVAVRRICMVSFTTYVNNNNYAFLLYSSLRNLYVFHILFIAFNIQSLL